MRRTLFLVALFVCGCPYLRHERPTVAERLDALAVATEADGTGIGLDVVDAASGAVVYQHLAHVRRTPASTLKLVTTSAILAALGPEFRFHTDVVIDGALSNGVLEGNLVVDASGDPSLGSWRFDEAAPEATCDRIAKALTDRGVSVWSGELKLSNPRDASSALGPGWAWDDAGDDYSAPPTRFVFRENVVEVRAKRASGSCDAPKLVMTPPVAAMVADLALDASDGKTKLACRRERGSPRVSCVLRASANACPAEAEAPVSVDDPRSLFASCVEAALARAHVEHRPTIAGPPAPSTPQPLVTLDSPTLAELVTATNKHSLNLYAERFALELTRRQAGAESYAALADVMRDAAAKLGVSPTELAQVDGSGLSRYDLASPAALVQVIRASLASPYGATYLASLPVSGVDGTLVHRTPTGEARGRVHAKSGSMSGVHAWAGVVERPGDARHSRLVFALMLDGLNAPTVAPGRLFDEAAEAMVTAPLR